MKILYLYLIALFGGICKAVTIDKAVSDCMIVKMQQCIADVLKSAPLIFLSGEKAVDAQVRKEFKDCLLEMAKCSPDFHATMTISRSQKQKDFCGDDEGCYDNDDEDEDNYSKDSPERFIQCFLKNKDMLFEALVDGVLEAFGLIRQIINPTNRTEIITPNMIMCRVLRNSIVYMKNILVKKCGKGGEYFWTLVKPVVKKNLKKHLYELCSLDSVL